MIDTIQDSEFGEIVIKKSSSTRRVSMKIGTDGRMVINAPKYTPKTFLKLSINNSRPELRKLIERTPRPSLYRHGQKIGQKHTISVVETNMVDRPVAKIHRNFLLLQLPSQSNISDNSVQQLIRDKIKVILKKEAGEYLPTRLAEISQFGDFSYSKVRLTHSGGRWGSCSSTGTISLNIALMQLPQNLRDYVLIHELCHTIELNHSSAFWALVEKYDPRFRLHKRQIKRYSPII